MAKRGDNIHKRIDGRWEGRYKKGRKPNGTIQYGSVYGKSYKEVKDKLIAVRQEPVIIKLPKHKEKTFADVLELWMQNNRIRLKGGSINKYQRLIDTHIIGDLGSVRVSEISSVVVNTFLEKKLNSGRVDGKGGLSASYVKSIMLVISAAINYAVQEQLCLPLKTPISKPVEETKELTILSLPAQKKLEFFVTNELTPTKAGIYISLYTGLRIGEVCALRWDDIDFVRKVIRVRHTIARVDCKNDDSPYKTKLIIDTPKTKASKREIPISTVLLPLLLILRDMSTSEFVISDTMTFVSPRTYEYRYHKVLKNCGIESVNYHTLRHTFATRCIEAGVDVKSLSEILGHSNVSVTLNTYVHSSIELKRIQLEKVTALSA